MWAAHDDPDAAIAEFTGDVVSADRVNGSARDGDQIGATLEVNILDLLVDQGDIPPRRGEGG